MDGIVVPTPGGRSGWCGSHEASEVIWKLAPGQSLHCRSILKDNEVLSHVEYHDAYGRYEQ